MTKPLHSIHTAVNRLLYRALARTLRIVQGARRGGDILIAASLYLGFFALGLRDSM